MQWNTNVNILPALNASFVDHLVTSLSVAGAQVGLLYVACYVFGVYFGDE
jgi:hypothetical protein